MTQSFMSNKFILGLGPGGKGGCALLPLIECTLVNGLRVGDGVMIETDLVVGEIGSSRVLLVLPGVSVLLMGLLMSWLMKVSAVILSAANEAKK